MRKFNGNRKSTHFIVFSPVEGTPDGWLSIDSKTGVIEVSGHQMIGCDVPKRDDLKYTIKLFDGKFEVEDEVCF